MSVYKLKVCYNKYEGMLMFIGVLFGPVIILVIVELGV